MSDEIEEKGDLSAPPAGLRNLAKEELREILTRHKKWIESEGREGRPADLGHTNLRGAVLLGENLKGANFQGASLYGAYLKSANLQNSNLAGANLRGAGLRRANLENTDLLGANLNRADFQGAKLKNARLGQSNLKYSRGLTQQQIDQACVHPTTLLPDHLQRPDWTRDCEEKWGSGEEPRASRE